MPSRRAFNTRLKSANDNPDHARRRQTPAPSDPEIERKLDELVKPAVFAELAYYRTLGLRNRILTLPVMVAVVLTLLWRQVPGVCTLQRLLARERVLWTEPTAVSQPALSERLRVFPAELFERVLRRVLDQLPARLAGRTPPVPPGLAALRLRFAGLYAMDGTTLEALFRKLGSLRERPEAPLAGHVVAVVDLLSHLPVQVWCAEDPAASEHTFAPSLQAWLPTESLVVFDVGYFAFPFFDALTEASSWFVTRMRQKVSFTVEQVHLDRPHVRDRRVHLGRYRSNPSRHAVRLIEVELGGMWHRYVTNVVDPQRLSVEEVVAAYEQRWQIETAFLLVKRLLGLSYLWVGSLNGVQLQVWATWLYYAILIDLCAEVADLLQLPLQRISVEMVSRSLYFYVGAVAHGYTGTAATYFADPANRDLGIVKRLRRARVPLAEQVRLVLSSSP